MEESAKPTKKRGWIVLLIIVAVVMVAGFAIFSATNTPSTVTKHELFKGAFIKYTAEVFARFEGPVFRQNSSKTQSGTTRVDIVDVTQDNITATYTSTGEAYLEKNATRTDKKSEFLTVSNITKHMTLVGEEKIQTALGEKVALHYHYENRTTNELGTFSEVGDVYLEKDSNILLLLQITSQISGPGQMVNGYAKMWLSDTNIGWLNPQAKSG